MTKPLRGNWLIRGLSTTVGQKLVMGATGLFLCGFLVVHLAGNLLLYTTPERYNHYADALHANELLPLAEAGLYLLFVLHIILAFVTAKENTAARPTAYAVKESKLDAPPLVFRPHEWMFWTGMIVLGFLVLHLIDMRFADWGIRGRPPANETPFQHAIRVIRDPVSATVYIIGSLFLGVHVWHGFQSAFRSLGISHPKYTPLIKTVSVWFAVIVAIGFASFPIWGFALSDEYLNSLGFR